MSFSELELPDSRIYKMHQNTQRWDREDYLLFRNYKTAYYNIQTKTVYIYSLPDNETHFWEISIKPVLFFTSEEILNPKVSVL